MNKKIAFLTAAMALTMPIAPAFADDTTGATSTTTDQAQTRQDMRAQWQANREQNQQTREANQQLREQNQTERAAIKDQADANRQQNQQTRCENVQAKIGERISEFENKKQTFGTAFVDMQARLEQLSTKLASAGVDVTGLNKDIQTLVDKITKMNQDHDAFLAALQDAKTTAASDCQATPKGGFMTKLLGARTQALTVQKDRLDVRNFFQTTIRPEIMAIRAKLADKATVAPQTITTPAITAPTTTAPAATTTTSAE